MRIFIRPDKMWIWMNGNFINIKSDGYYTAGDIHVTKQKVPVSWSELEEEDIEKFSEKVLKAIKKKMLAL